MLLIQTPRIGKLREKQGRIAVIWEMGSGGSMVTAFLSWVMKQFGMSGDHGTHCECNSRQERNQTRMLINVKAVAYCVRTDFLILRTLFI